MRTYFRYKLFILLITALSACSATGPKFHPAPRAPDGSALVYLMHSPGRFADLWAVTFYRDEMEVASLDDENYSWLHLPQGTYEFSVMVDSKPLKVLLKVEAGKEYFLELKQNRFQFTNYNLVFEQADTREARLKIVDYKYKASMKNR